MAGFEAFTPLFGAVVLAAIGIAVGFLALFIPGVYLAVRWYFVPQAVVIEGVARARPHSPFEPDRPGLLVAHLRPCRAGEHCGSDPEPPPACAVQAIAASTDESVWALVGTILATSVTTPFVALFSTLLYYDLLARRTSPIS